MVTVRFFDSKDKIVHVQRNIEMDISHCVELIRSEIFPQRERVAYAEVKSQDTADFRRIFNHSHYGK